MNKEERKEKRNAYFCQKCRRAYITVDIDEGTTPMIIHCDACGSYAISMMYSLSVVFKLDLSEGRYPPNEMKPDFEFYKPGQAEYAGLLPSQQEHVDNGGLLMRKREI